MKNAVVSFYADDFHGKKTSSGEIFDMNALTCANKSLPFNTLLKVTNLANGKSVTVRVNDRGPFVADRELDLSKAAAEKLGMVNSGTARVDIEIIKRGEDTELSRVTAQKAMQMVSKKSASSTKTSSANSATAKTSTTKSATASATAKKTYPAGTYWDLQVGAFSTRENANVLAQKLLKSGFTDVVFQKTSTVYRVVIRKVPAEKVEQTRQKLVKQGFGEPVIKERKS